MSTNIYCFDVTISGADTYYGETPLVADLVDAVSKTISCKCVNIIPNTSFEQEEYDGKLLLSSKTSNFKGELEFTPFTNPKKAAEAGEHVYDNAVSFINFFDFMPALLKQFTYIFSADYQVVLADLAKINKCVRVDFTSIETDITQSGFKKYVKLGFMGGQGL